MDTSQTDVLAPGLVTLTMLSAKMGKLSPARAYPTLHSSFFGRYSGVDI
jgi:hypothetical protein